MKIIVTGNSGFIGRWVCRFLINQGKLVYGLDIQSRPDDLCLKEHLLCDLLEKQRIKDYFMRIQPDAVIHLAARIDLNEKKNIEGYNANIDGVRNITGAIRDCKSVHRAIFTSSQLVCKVGYIPSSENDFCPDTLYGESKVLTEQIVREEAGGNTEWCIVRPTTIWGPGMSEHYQKLLRMIERNRYFHCGTSPLLKSYGYVENTAYQYTKIFIAQSNSIHQKVFYLADYEPLSLREYTIALQKRLAAKRIPTVPLPLARLLAITGDLVNSMGWRSFPFNSFRLRNILTEYIFDLSATRQVCGELPVPFQQGIDRTISWFQSLK